MTETIYHLTYVMQRGDFVALTRALSRRNLLASALLIGGASVLGYLIGAGGHFVAPPDSKVFWITVALDIAILLVVLFPLRWLYLWFAAAAIYRRNAAADKTMRFDINDDTITGGMPGMSTTLTWANVTRLIETPDRLFVAISRREAMILPRRAFPDAAAYTAFLAFAQGRVAATRTAVPVDPAAPSA